MITLNQAAPSLREMLWESLGCFKHPWCFSSTGVPVLSRKFILSLVPSPSLECSHLAKTKILPLLLLVLSAVFIGPLAVPPIHGQTGTVCFADPSFVFTGPCPSSSAVFSGPVGQLIRIGVFISGSDGLNSFDITMLANFAFLKPAGIDLHDTVLLGTPTVVLECLGGNVIAGTRSNSCSNHWPSFYGHLQHNRDHINARYPGWLPDWLH